MLYLEGNNIKKYFGDRLILDIDNIKLYKGDKIGLVGINGMGKTTLLNILSKKVKADEGSIKIHGSLSFIEQINDMNKDYKLDKLNSEDFKILGKNINDLNINTMSGGEITRLKIQKAFMEMPHVLFADEPTTNLDLSGIEELEKKLKLFKGAVLLVSHDKRLMDEVCNKIIEIKDGKLYEYPGNYSDYKILKAEAVKRKNFEYEQYIKEKSRLEAVLQEKIRSAKNIKTTPKRMGNSEARLHKRKVNSKIGKIEKTALAVKSRIERLEVKEKVKEDKAVVFDLHENMKIYSKVLIKGERIYKSFGDRVLFNNSSLCIKNGKKTGLIGDNGSGKTTLIKMILKEKEREENQIKISKAIKIGCFDQKLENLDINKSILENVMEDSIYSETMVRIILARLLFKKDDVYKRVGVLSGGERVKVSIAKILVSDFNFLILDEPTNFLDITSKEGLLTVLKEYPGGILIVSHDRDFLDEISDRLLIIKDKNILSHIGNYSSYINSKIEDVNKNRKNTVIELENKIACILGKLSMPSKDTDIDKLDKEYKLLVKELRRVKSKMEEEK